MELTLTEIILFSSGSAFLAFFVIAGIFAHKTNFVPKFAARGAGISLFILIASGIWWALNL